MKKTIAVFGAVLASLTIFSGCGETEEFSTQGKYFFAMNAEATLVVSDKFTPEKQNDFSRLCGDITSTLTALDGSLSSNDKSNSSISRFNDAAAGERVEIDFTAYSVLTLAKSVYRLTEGYYNPAVYYNVQAYGFNEATDIAKPPEQRIPSDAVVEKYNRLSQSFGEIQLVEEDNKYYAVKPTATVEVDGVTCSMKIDLGGIGKGYAVDEINKLIDSYGFKYGYLSFGTSSILVKEHYVNGSYSLGFTNPRADAQSNVYVSTFVKSECLSTSGDYEQFFMYDSDNDGVKERYCHVFDPTTGRPVQTGIMSATVIGGSAAEDDALTTAIMAMGKEKAVEFINEKLSARKVVFCYDNNGKYEVITNIPESEIKIMHDKFEIVNTVSDGKIVLG